MHYFIRKRLLYVLPVVKAVPVMPVRIVNIVRTARRMEVHAVFVNSHYRSVKQFTER